MGHRPLFLLTDRRLCRCGRIRRPGAARLSEPDQDIDPRAIEAYGHILAAEHLATEIPREFAHTCTKGSTRCHIVPMVAVANHTVDGHEGGQPIAGNGYPG